MAEPGRWERVVADMTVTRSFGPIPKLPYYVPAGGEGEEPTNYIQAQGSTESASTPQPEPLKSCSVETGC